MSKSAPKTKRVTKRERRAARRAEHGNAVEIIPGVNPEMSYGTTRKPTKPLTCRTDKQKTLLNYLETKPMVITEGPAGCGKTYVPVRWAMKRLLENEIETLIVTRPYVLAADEEEAEIGALPGDLNEKFEPFFRPVKDIILKDVTESHLENLMKRGRIEVAPLPFIRGRTFENCVIILDEAQNISPKSMKLLLTRLGENATILINGDLSQKDIENASGLADVMERFNTSSVCGMVLFETKDSVRSAFVREVLARYTD